ncbi:IS66 family transposase zinc-finger binding domain-containing protein [Cypionkella sp.]|uniref:IS66 family transposase zinc-finger binding domain-containing protein n=1 Tax=Cypionkella sp. TaxID=2811411 RepID=UPI00345C568B
MEVELTPKADACADSGGRVRWLGEDVAEELEYISVRFIVNRIFRRRLTCACCERFAQVPLPSRPLSAVAPGRPAGTCSVQRLCGPPSVGSPEPDLRP